MGKVIFGTSDATPMSAEETVGFHERRQFQCPHCGRFAKHLGESQEYDGNGTQLYVSWSCSRCGERTEGPLVTEKHPPQLPALSSRRRGVLH